MILSAGAFDAWGSNLLSGLLGVAAALAAIWLTRHFDRKKTLDEAALTAAESVNTTVAQFYKEWASINVTPPDQWHNQLSDKITDARLAIAVKSPAIRDKQLENYLRLWMAFMVASLAEAKGIIEDAKSRPGYDKLTFDWEGLTGQFNAVDERIGSACRELVDLLINWRTTLKFNPEKGRQGYIADFDNQRKFAQPVASYVPDQI